MAGLATLLPHGERLLTELQTQYAAGTLGDESEETSSMPLW